MAKNKDASGFSERLRAVIERGGGPSSVARTSGIPLSSVNSYLESTEAPASRAVLLARACSVSYEWLAIGDGNQGQSSAPLENEMLDTIVNFYLLLLSIRTCREHFENKPKPTLREVLNWIAGPYALRDKIPDYKIEFQPVQDLST